MMIIKKVINVNISEYVSSVIVIFRFIQSSCKHSTLHMNVNVVKGMFHWYKTLSGPEEVVGGARHSPSLAWFQLLTR